MLDALTFDTDYEWLGTTALARYRVDTTGSGDRPPPNGRPERTDRQYKPLGH
ncbi:hypothetical protein [Salinigranum halophilum]|uniref:hypothetical protein n=1 Tax=Salinigranum halophilum TaxID=2565931 RepID=UPI0013754A98|nr:hypothetical protein [Salinigranum halophilum]